MTHEEIIKALKNYPLKTQAIFEAIDLIKRQAKAIQKLKEENEALKQQLHHPCPHCGTKMGGKRKENTNE